MSFNGAYIVGLRKEWGVWKDFGVAERDNGRPAKWASFDANLTHFLTQIRTKTSQKGGGEKK